MTDTATEPFAPERAARLLASYVDSGDRRVDGRTARLAQRLLGVPADAWGPAVTQAIWRAARDARFALLADHGVDVDDLSEPPAADGPVRVRAVFERDGHDGVLLVCSYDQSLWQDVKALPERHYDPERKEWTLPATRATAEALVGLLNAHQGFTVAPATATRLRALLSGAEPSAASRRAEPAGKRAWRVFLPKPTAPRDYALLASVRKLPGARFFGPGSRGPAHWRIDTSQAGAVDALAAWLGEHPEVELSDEARLALPGATLTVATGPAPAEPAPVATSGEVKANRKTFSIDPADDPAVKAKAQRLLGSKYDRDAKRYRVPRHELSAPGLAALIAEHPQLAVSPATRQAIDRLASAERLRTAHADKVAYFSAAKEIPADAVDSVLEGFGKTLHPFQRIPVIYPRLGVRRFWLADSMGLGKTVEAEAVLYAERAWPAVITCPPSHRGNWRRELLEAIPGATVAIVRGKTPEPEAIADADFVVIQHDLIVHWLDALLAREFVAFVADESHAFVNAGSKAKKDGEVKGTKRTWAVSELAADIRGRDGLVMLLTGTPKKNGRNAELIPQLEILGELERIGAALSHPPNRVSADAKQRFLWHFCDPQPHKFAAGGYSYDGSSNDLDLHGLLRATCYVRRHKTEVLDQLPPKQRPLVPLELTATALRDYRKAQEDIVRFLREHHGQRAELAALLQGLSREHARQVAADIARKAGEAASRAPGLVEMNTLRRLLAEAKLPQVIDWTQTFLAGSDTEKLVLFAVHKYIQAELVAAFPGCAHIISGDSVEHIEADKARFQTDPKCRLIVCSLGVAKEGHTLTAASNVAFCELDWAPLALEQAEDRVYGRMNDLHGATCHYLLGVGPENWIGFKTIDEVMAARIDQKRRSNAATVDGAAAEAVAGESILADVVSAIAGAAA